MAKTNIRHKKCDLCGKVYLVETTYKFGASDEDYINDKKDEIERVKEN
ncbi:MAG: hypothetical protein GBAus27B_000347 [Mycoplasmataceae bacterium]|nr:MAG: hypothetical protein GBAus27B_000347 [Mycoplasmataceae bacterium]